MCSKLGSDSWDLDRQFPNRIWCIATMSRLAKRMPLQTDSDGMYNILAAPAVEHGAFRETRDDDIIARISRKLLASLTLRNVVLL